MHVVGLKLIEKVFRAETLLAFFHYSYTVAKSLQSRPTLCDPVDCSPLGSSVRGILHARILKWVAGLPCLPPGDLPDPWGRTLVSYVSCLGRRVLYC